MTPEHAALWNKIKNFEIDDVEAPLTFTDRLARENGWRISYSLRAVEEYKRFMFLMCLSNRPLTPSDQIDQVWHLHLIYTHSYWDEFCGSVLNRKIHHGPTKGGKQEKEKYTDWYGQTKELYREVFAINPPADIWPDNKLRFSDINFQRINLNRNWIIPKINFLRR